MGMADSDRLEREIEEILGRIDQLPPPESRAKRTVRRSLRRLGTAISDRQRAIARELSRVSMSQMILLSFLMILGSFFLRRVSPLLMDWLMYGGVILMALGWACWRHGWLSVVYVALLFVCLDVKARREEQWLIDKYPAYADYKRRVRRLVPFVY